jgi:acetate kinase
VEETNIITLHLEGGSSATAVRGGKSIDTSMGFTPLEGLMMGTRSGDLDPALVGFLARKENTSAEEIESLLNKKSGLLGVSGTSSDTRELIRDPKDSRADLALEMFSYRVRKYIGAYLAAMNGASAVVFGGGISENTPEVRRRICRNLEWLGLEVDDDRNLRTVDREGEITREGSRVRALVIPAEEGLMIAHQAGLLFSSLAPLPVDFR